MERIKQFTTSLTVMEIILDLKKDGFFFKKVKVTVLVIGRRKGHWTQNLGVFGVTWEDIGRTIFG